MLKIKEVNSDYCLFDNEQNLGICKPMLYPRDKTGYIYKLPKNSLNRAYINGSKICDGLTLEPRLEKICNNKNWQSYLTTEEKAKIEEAQNIIEQLKAAAIERSKQPLSEEQKLQKEIEKLQRQLQQNLAKLEGIKKPQ